MKKVFCLFLLIAIVGCESSIAIKKSNNDAGNSVNGTVTQDVPFIADYIANTWAQHETNQANRLYEAAINENGILATVQSPIPSPGTPTPPSTIKIVPDNLRIKLDNKHNLDLKQIDIGKQQIYGAVVNRFKGNLTAAQNLLQGQTNYYNGVGANTTTLDNGIDTILTLFQKYAPTLINKK